MSLPRRNKRIKERLQDWIVGCSPSHKERRAFRATDGRFVPGSNDNDKALEFSNVGAMQEIPPVVRLSVLEAD